MGNESDPFTLFPFVLIGWSTQHTLLLTYKFAFSTPCLVQCPLCYYFLRWIHIIFYEPISSRSHNKTAWRITSFTQFLTDGPLPSRKRRVKSVIGFQTEVVSPTAYEFSSFPTEKLRETINEMWIVKNTPRTALMIYLGGLFDAFKWWVILTWCIFDDFCFNVELTDLSCWDDISPNAAKKWKKREETHGWFGLWWRSNGSTGCFILFNFRIEVDGNRLHCDSREWFS